MYNEGISKVGDILDLGVELELIDRRGSYYSYGETRLGQGRENAKEFLRENPEIAQEIEQAIREQSGMFMDEIEAQEEPEKESES
jgi:recombination protein RecA